MEEPADKVRLGGMADPALASDEERAAWHRSFAVATFNRSWELLEQPERSSDDDAELLATAFASRWHWSQAGNDQNQALGDHQIAKVASALGMGSLALLFAGKALAVRGRGMGRLAPGGGV